MIRRFALLQTFVAVARAGKMKQAARELALTPGAVSQRIRQLEEVAGRRLFTRTSTGVELSAAGEAMFVALAEPFQAIDSMCRCRCSRFPVPLTSVRCLSSRAQEVHGSSFHPA
jgi:DNA-binding transcriptional LysR family regulator